MKTKLFMASGFFLMVMTLGSWTFNTDQSHTVDATYLGYVEDEDLGEAFYSFETSETYLDFYKVNPAVLKAYDLRSSELDGSQFELTYSEDDETGEIVLEKLSLIE